jgi:hypothetical protein
VVPADGTGHLSLRFSAAVSEKLNADNAASALPAFVRLEAGGQTLVQRSLFYYGTNQSFDFTFDPAQHIRPWRIFATCEGGVWVELLGGAEAMLLAMDESNLKPIDDLWLAGRFISATRAPNGEVELKFLGAPGRSYRFEYSLDLATWSQFFTAAAGWEEVIVPDTAANRQRFYRAKLLSQ